LGYVTMHKTWPGCDSNTFYGILLIRTIISTVILVIISPFFWS
jgi:hypothetical protein